MTASTVYVVDDDPGLRDSLCLLLESAGLRARPFGSAGEFLAACAPDWNGCIVLDVRMPGMSGPELHQELERRGICLPVVFLTAHAELRTGIEAMQRGAVDYVSKPVHGAALLAAIRQALARGRADAEEEAARRAYRKRYDKLTERERQVHALVVAGQSTREIAESLQLSLRTVDSYRSRILLKFQAKSSLQLARQAVAMGGAKPANESGPQLPVCGRPRR